MNRSKKIKLDKAQKIAKEKSEKSLAIAKSGQSPKKKVEESKIEADVNQDGKIDEKDVEAVKKIIKKKKKNKKED